MFIIQTEHIINGRDAIYEAITFFDERVDAINYIKDLKEKNESSMYYSHEDTVILEITKDCRNIMRVWIQELNKPENNNNKRQRLFQ